MTPERLLFWAGFCSVLFAALAGVAGVAAWYLSDQVGAAKDAALEKFKADSRAMTAAADARAAEANENAALAHERAVKLELEAAAQRERAAKAEQELEELRQKIAPRAISREQVERMVRALQGSPAPARWTIRIESLMGDAECTRYAGQIERIFTSAGWTTTSAQVLYDGGPPVGAAIVIRSNDSPNSETAALLQRLFESAGIEFRVTINPRGRDVRPFIRIGTKPA
jgi:hypothetical protein